MKDVNTIEGLLLECGTLHELLDDREERITKLEQACQQALTAFQLYGTGQKSDLSNAELICIINHALGFKKNGELSKCCNCSISKELLIVCDKCNQECILINPEP